VRTGADVTALAYIQGRRDLAEARRVIERIFETIDVLVTPTTPVPPPTIAEISKDVGTSMRLGAPYIRNTSPFDVYGIPTISVPCGFTINGLPIGLQISGPNGGEASAQQLGTSACQTCRVDPLFAGGAFRISSQCGMNVGGANGD